MLSEEEATYLSVVFEETGAYQYKKNKEAESGSSGGGGAGLKAGFEEDFSFGGEDDNDYWDKTEVD